MLNCPSQVTPTVCRDLEFILFQLNDKGRQLQNWISGWEALGNILLAILWGDPGDVSSQNTVKVIVLELILYGPGNSFDLATADE